MCSVVFLPVYSQFKGFRRSHVCHMCLFLPVQSLLIHEALLPALRTLSLSSLTLPQTVRLYNVSLLSQAPQQQYTVLSFSSMRRHVHSHKLTSSCAYGITLWAYLSEPLVKDSHKNVTCLLRRGIRKHCT